MTFNANIISQKIIRNYSKQPLSTKPVNQHHFIPFQVNGEVFAVDAYTFLIRNFIYDGNGKDTFFWAGSSNRPSSKGYIVPDKNGRTNVLSR